MKRLWFLLARHRRVILCVSLITMGVCAGLSCAAGQSNTLKGEQQVSYPSYERTDNSPDFQEEEFGIKLAFTGKKSEATFGLTEPLIVFGAYRVGEETLKEIGTDISQALVLVVTHKESSALFWGKTLKDDPPQKPRSSSESTGGRVVSAKSYFNIDLRTQCRIPSLPGKYWVRVLLGTMSSPVLSFEVK
jgi:hypothetical protein